MMKNNSEHLRFAVVGAGAVGCYFGGILARAGHHVTLIGRPHHVSAIQQHGLLLTTQQFEEHIPLHASTDLVAIHDADVILFCVKSTDTIATAEQLKSHLSADAVILSLQNGVENAELLRSVLPHQVIPAVVYVATEMVGDGHVKHNGRGELVIGSSSASELIASVLTVAAIPTQVSENVIGALWAKLIVNCAYNALSAITQLPYGQLVQQEGVLRMMEELVVECLTVASAAGVVVPGDSRENVKQIARTMADQTSSTAQDLARGKRSEIDFLNGYVNRQGLLHHVPTPVNHALTSIVKMLEKSSA
jgi:2-dehydropantoate 2-reductase